MLQVLFHSSPMCEICKGHMRLNCLKEYCLACELGFLFRKSFKRSSSLDLDRKCLPLAISNVPSRNAGGCQGLELPSNQLSSCFPNNTPGNGFGPCPTRTQPAQGDSLILCSHSKFPPLYFGTFEPGMQCGVGQPRRCARSRSSGREAPLANTTNIRSPNGCRQHVPGVHLVSVKTFRSFCGRSPIPSQGKASRPMSTVNYDILT